MLGWYILGLLFRTPISIRTSDRTGDSSARDFTTATDTMLPCLALHVLISMRS
jgi:hypothetical protein